MVVKRRPSSDFDTPWKEAIELFFPPFIQFFFPHIYHQIDWKRGYEFLDKELQQARPRGRFGRRTVDKLVKVWRMDGQEAWVLIHVEVQNREQAEFPQRMYVYGYRLFDRFGVPVVSLAILGDSNPDWRPSEYGYELWGASSQHRFPMVKLLDYEAQWEMLEKSTNPFALLVMVHLRALSTQGKPRSRREWKLRLSKGLYEKGWKEEQVVQMFRFIDWMMALPPALEKSFEKDLRKYEEERKMPSLAPFERRAIKKGFDEGEKQGQKQGGLETARRLIITAVDARWGVAPPAVQDTITGMEDLAQLEALHRKAITAGSLEEFERILKG